MAIFMFSKHHLNYILKYKYYTADMDLLKMVLVKILLNFGNHFRTLQMEF